MNQNPEFVSAKLNNVKKISKIVFKEKRRKPKHIHNCKTNKTLFRNIYLVPHQFYILGKKLGQH